MYLSISAITACNLAQELQKMRVCAVGLRREGMSGAGCIYVHVGTYQIGFKTATSAGQDRGCKLGARV